MTRAGFPHSDILGSRFVCQLPEAYRRLPRPSSAPSAKASTLCPYKLDHKDHSKRCSRPLCSSQATTGHRILVAGAVPRNRERYDQQDTARRPRPDPHPLKDDDRAAAPKDNLSAVPSGPNSVPSQPLTTGRPSFPPHSKLQAY